MTKILVPDAVGGGISGARRVVEHPAWPVLKNAVEEIRPWQSKDGSIDFEAEEPRPVPPSTPRSRG